MLFGMKRFIKGYTLAWYEYKLEIYSNGASVMPNVIMVVYGKSFSILVPNRQSPDIGPRMIWDPLS
jgi:hypothetical protein